MLLKKFESGENCHFFLFYLSNSLETLENKIKPAFIGGLVYLGWGS